ncbi:MAG: Holliday junction resolvase RuvX [Dysgonamonadaceae bacterium]|jgi:putative Holliday junction resolvase|nr:Holliday junction resolvase RuvX [Dysgonamonadaceae bacterium]
MGRIVAIDYGKKRTGLAVSDPMRLIAGGLTTLPSHTVIAFLKQYILENEVDLFLLGEPRQMDYQPSENMGSVLKFKQQLQQSIPNIEIKMVDERFTSVLAHQTMLMGGLKKKDRRNKAMVDELSATILLQSYLETISISI